MASPNFCTYIHTHIHTYIHTDISPILIFLSSWDPETPKTIKNSRVDFYAKTLLSPYWEKVKLFRIHESGSDSESLFLAESKNTNFIKIGGTKKTTAQIPWHLPYTTTLFDFFLKYN